MITHEHEIAARFPRQIVLLDGRIVSDPGSLARTQSALTAGDDDEADPAAGEE